jgi:hypothetical protein
MHFTLHLITGGLLRNCRALVRLARLPGLSQTVSVFQRKRYRTPVSQYDAERKEKSRVHILRIARQLIAGEIGIIAASRERGCLRYETEPQLATVLVTFTAIDSETDALPVGDVRKEWSPDALERKDKEIAEAENFYRESAINAAAELIRLLETPS